MEMSNRATFIRCKIWGMQKNRSNKIMLHGVSSLLSGLNVVLTSLSVLSSAARSSLLKRTFTAPFSPMRYDTSPETREKISSLFRSPSNLGTQPREIVSGITLLLVSIFFQDSFRDIGFALSTRALTCFYRAMPKRFRVVKLSSYTRDLF